MSKIAIIANAKARAHTGWASCEALVRGHANAEVYVVGTLPLDDLVTQAWEHGCQTVVAAGGDGTISSVVSALVRLQLPVRLGVLPIGTRNHFAKDLHIPLEIAEALRVIENGQTIQIDIAKVNDHYFINNSSIGLYPYLVHVHRGLERHALHTGFAFVHALVAVFVRNRAFEVSFGKGTDLVAKKTLGIFIGNNKYRTSGLEIGSRPKLDEGTLFIALLKNVGALEILTLVYKAFLGTALADDNLDSVGLQECTIDSTKKDLLVSYDGEVAHMTPPLQYSIVPRALSVIVPKL